LEGALQAGSDRRRTLRGISTHRFAQGPSPEYSIQQTIKMSDELGLGPTLLGVMFSLTTLSTIIVILRWVFGFHSFNIENLAEIMFSFYCRAKIIGSVTIDDYLIGFARVQTWGLCVSNYFHVYYGTGKHAQ
jgi:hypothetical protein